MSTELLKTLPDVFSHGRVDNIELAHEMALAMDPWEEQRIKWQAVRDRLRDNPDGLYGRTSSYKKELSQLAEVKIPLDKEFLTYAVREDAYKLSYEEQDAKVAELDTEKGWLQHALRLYHRREGYRQRNSKGEYFRGSEIPNKFVTMQAEELVRHFSGQSGRAAQTVHFMHQAHENVQAIRDSLVGDEPKTFAPLPRPNHVPRPFRFFDKQSGDSPAVIKIQSELEKLTDIQQRKEAYFALVKLFGGSAVEGSVTRKDVLALRRVLDKHYVSLNFH